MTLEELAKWHEQQAIIHEHAKDLGDTPLYYTYAVTAACHRASAAVCRSLLAHRAYAESIIEDEADSARYDHHDAIEHHDAETDRLLSEIPHV
jgi:hypothetical protein